MSEEQKEVKDELTEEELQKALQEFDKNLRNSQVDTPIEFQAIMHEHFWDLI